jgi:hypothetical protein
VPFDSFFFTAIRKLQGSTIGFHSSAPNAVGLFTHFHTVCSNAFHKLLSETKLSHHPSAALLLIHPSTRGSTRVYNLNQTGFTARS